MKEIEFIQNLDINGIVAIEKGKSFYVQNKGGEFKIKTNTKLKDVETVYKFSIYDLEKSGILKIIKNDN